MLIRSNIDPKAYASAAPSKQRKKASVVNTGSVLSDEFSQSAEDASTKGLTPTSANENEKKKMSQPKEQQKNTTDRSYKPKLGVDANTDYMVSSAAAALLSVSNGLNSPFNQNKQHDLDEQNLFKGSQDNGIGSDVYMQFEEDIMEDGASTHSDTFQDFPSPALRPTSVPTPKGLQTSTHMLDFHSPSNGVGLSVTKRNPNFSNMSTSLNSFPPSPFTSTDTAENMFTDTEDSPKRNAATHEHDLNEQKIHITDQKSAIVKSAKGLMPSEVEILDFAPSLVSTLGGEKILICFRIIDDSVEDDEEQLFQFESYVLYGNIKIATEAVGPGVVRCFTTPQPTPRTVTLNLVINGVPSSPCTINCVDHSSMSQRPTSLVPSISLLTNSSSNASHHVAIDPIQKNITDDFKLPISNDIHNPIHDEQRNAANGNSSSHTNLKRLKRGRISGFSDFDFLNGEDETHNLDEFEYDIEDSNTRKRSLSPAPENPEEIANANVENMEEEELSVHSNAMLERVVQLLLDYVHEYQELRGEVNALDASGYNLLHYTVIYNKEELLLKLLTHASVDSNCFTSVGDTPLHLAAEAGHENIVDILLKHHADPTVTDAKGYYPHQVAWTNGYKSIARKLSELCEASFPGSGKMVPDEDELLMGWKMHRLGKIDEDHPLQEDQQEEGNQTQSLVGRFHVYSEQAQQPSDALLNASPSELLLGSPTKIIQQQSGQEGDITPMALAPSSPKKSSDMKVFLSPMKQGGSSASLIASSPLGRKRVGSMASINGQGGQIGMNHEEKRMALLRDALSSLSLKEQYALSLGMRTESSSSLNEMKDMASNNSQGMISPPARLDRTASSSSAVLNRTSSSTTNSQSTSSEHLSTSIGAISITSPTNDVQSIVNESQSENHVNDLAKLSIDERAFVEHEASKIQANFRKWMLRRNYVTMKEATISLQSVTRDFLKRKQQKREAVVALQAAARGILARRNFRDLKKKFSTSIIIQRSMQDAENNNNSSITSNINNNSMDGHT